MSKPELDPRTVVQRRALAKVSKHFLNDKKRRGQINWACGTGKTRLGLSVQQKLARAGKARITVVCCPSLDLVDQIRSEWIANAKQPFVSQSVCSEADEGFVNLDRDYAALNATTDPSVIRTTIQECCRQKKSIVLFATYHSLPKIHEALNVARMPKIDLCIFDEAHHCAGNDTMFSQWLSDKDIRIQYRLFLTATPKVVTRVAKEKADEDGLSYTSMDDVAIYGPVLDHISHAEAIERCLIVPYQLNIFTVNDDDLLAKIENPKLSILRRQAAYSGLFRGMKIRGSRKALCYHNSVPEIKELCGLTGISRHSIAEIWKQCKRRNNIKGKLWAKCIYSDGMSKKQRAEIIREFHEQDSETYAVLLSVRTIREGIDLTGADTVGLMTSMKSTTDIIQASMRGCRRHPGKKRAHIFVPLFTANDSVTKDGEFRGSPIKTDFSNVIDILRSLSIMDPEIVAELKKRYEDDKYSDDFEKLAEQAAKQTDSLKSNNDEDPVQVAEYFKHGRDIDETDEQAAEELGYDSVQQYRDDVASRIGVSTRRLQTDLIGRILYRAIVPRMLKAYSRPNEYPFHTVEQLKNRIIGEFRERPLLNKQFMSSDFHGFKWQTHQRILKEKHGITISSLFDSIFEISPRSEFKTASQMVKALKRDFSSRPNIHDHTNLGKWKGRSWYSWQRICESRFNTSLVNVRNMAFPRGLSYSSQARSLSDGRLRSGIRKFANELNRLPSRHDDAVCGIRLSVIRHACKNWKKIILEFKQKRQSSEIKDSDIRTGVIIFYCRNSRWPTQKSDIICGCLKGTIDRWRSENAVVMIRDIIHELGGPVPVGFLSKISDDDLKKAVLQHMSNTGSWPKSNDSLFGITVNNINDSRRNNGLLLVSEIIEKCGGPPSRKKRIVP